ncbi:phage baseplate assembly protein V [Duganella sp. SG902]|uniref:phage baseplate assembly protein V n=1 Tax=Duganella sp. SG902 TaxID=2587016 RepID=UPI00159DB814|nr:phage baseplate assembly protein V [Duganella sp. SG902]NVM78910.1 phage baseplate assembly protein V [Duganella sp. SG902]
MSVDTVMRAVNRALGKIRQAFRAVLTTVDSSTPIQLIQGEALAGEQLQDNELMQHYGFTSVPLPGTQLAVLPIGGKTAHGIVIACEHTQYRLKGLQGGEVAIYDDLGQFVHLTRDGIVVNGGGLKVTVTNTPEIELDAPLVTATKDLKVARNISAGGNVNATGAVGAGGSISAGGDIKDKVGSMAGMRDTYNGHKHGNTPTPDKSM